MKKSLYNVTAIPTEVLTKLLEVQVAHTGLTMFTPKCNWKLPLLSKELK